MKGTYNMNGESIDWRSEDHSKDREKLVKAIEEDLCCAADDYVDMHIEAGFYCGLEKSWSFRKTREGKEYVKVFTRESRNRSLNCNGGDYDCWVIYTPSRRWINRRDEWSADWDRLDYGGTDESYRVAGKELVSLFKQAEAKIIKEILFRKF